MAIAARPSRSISLLLAALTLASGLLPPSLGHAHPDGDRPHRHDRGHDHLAGSDHVAAHHGGHAGHPRGPDPAGPALGRPETAHLHLDLGAFGLTIPTPSGAPEGLGRPAPGGPAILAADDEPIPARLREARIAAAWPASLAVSWVEAAPPPLPSPRSAASPGTSPPLCDAARHERSGVLRT